MAPSGTPAASGTAPAQQGTGQQDNAQRSTGQQAAGQGTGQLGTGQLGTGRQEAGAQATGQPGASQPTASRQDAGQQATGQPDASQQSAQQGASHQSSGQQGTSVTQQWKIQPLAGEPPLTLYRDKRMVLLPAGTEVDRFGDPTGNVTYAARTQYQHRSLPPDWSNFPYHAYRVQRPLEALTGLAVPWFEQPGGGTAFVLPRSIADLVADGLLVEIEDAAAPR